MLHAGGAESGEDLLMRFRRRGEPGSPETPSSFSAFT
jgi:hypothetical protein